MSKANLLHISRETYRRVKAMNREELETYLNNVSLSAYNQGVESVSNKMAGCITRGLSNTKGIGEKRAAEILESINTELTKGE